MIWRAIINLNEKGYFIFLGLAWNDLIHSLLPANEHLKSTTNSADILARLGSLKLRNDDIAVNDILNFLQEYCLANLSNSIISKCVKLQHPKALLQLIANESDYNVVLRTTKLSDEVYESELNLELGGETEKFIERYATSKESERLVCVTCLESDKFIDKFNEININDLEFPLEDDVYLGPIDNQQRTVTLAKSENESFGFSIKGGEQKVIKNKDFIQLHTITPVFVSNIVKDSPAERCGLKVGDVLLKINDHVIKDLTHKQAVVTLKKFLHYTEMDFIVSYEKMELLKYEAQEKMIERQKQKLRTEIKSGKLSKWHHAKAKEDPDEYFLETVEDKKRISHAKKGRKAVRLWEIKSGKYTN